MSKDYLEFNLAEVRAFSKDESCARVLYAEIERLRGELAKERARLDWLLLDVVSRFDDAYYTRATIDAKMKEGAK